MALFDERGNPLGPTTFVGKGGEGEILGLDRFPSQVAKIYFPSAQGTAEKQRKLEAMIAAPPNDPAQSQGHISIAWPTGLAFDQQRSFVGFLMPRIDTSRSRKLIEIYSPASYPRGMTWADLLLVARNIAFALAALHHERYVIGDLNEANILVADNGLVTFVDCDSMQVPDPRSSKVFRCPVGRGEYTAPEMQGVAFDSVDRSPETDVFALAVVIGQLLLLGRHPFSGGPSQKIEDNLRNGASFLFTPGAQGPSGTPPTDILPPRILALFVRCFRDGHRTPAFRPSAQEWGDAMDEARRNTRTCTARQIHRYHGHLADCPWCLYERQHGFDPFTYLHGAQQTFNIPPPPPARPHPRPPKSARAVAAGLAVVAVLVAGGLALRQTERIGTVAEPTPSPLPVSPLTAALKSPRDLLGFYSGLEKTPGEHGTLVTLQIRSVGEEAGGEAPLHYTRNTLTERRDGIGSLRIDQGLITLSSAESYRASADMAGKLILVGESATLRRTDPR